MAHTIFESINMGSTHFAERIFDCVADVDIDNGTFGYMDGLVEGETDIYKFVPGFKAGEKVVVADQPAWNPDDSRRENQRRDNFFIPAGMHFRVRVVKVNDEFGISISGFTDKTVEGVSDYTANEVSVTIDSATGKLVAAAGAPAEDAVFAGRIMRKRIMGATLVTPLRTYGEEIVMYEAKIKVLA